MTNNNFSPALIHLDDALLVAEKPAGMLAVPGRGEDKQDCFSARIQQKIFDALVVHRLDMATSGLMVFARGREMHRRISAMFRERRVAKKYIAVVAGQMQTAGEIDLPLGADWPNRPRQRLDFFTGKPSLTKYRLLEHDAGTNTSRVELEPLTGRTHQLRVHLSAAGHPIAGDELYGGSSSRRLLLHACSLSFVHPLSGELVTATCDAPF